MLACLLCFLSLTAHVSSARAARSTLSPSPVCMTTGPLSLLREALPFCGGKVGSPTCCTLDDDANLHRAFADELRKHDYDDPQCRATLKAVICAVCLPSTPAAEPFSSTAANTSNDSSSLPLRCAAATPSISIHDLASPIAEPPTPEPEWLVADDKEAPTTPKWLIAVAAVLSALLGGFITYKIRRARLECCNNIRIRCCLC